MSDTSKTVWYAAHPMGLQMLGYIPTFLHDEDPRGAREQFNERYIGRWDPMEGFSMNLQNGVLRYPQDPPLRPVAFAKFREEKIYVYPHAWVAVVQQDGSFEVCRMD